MNAVRHYSREARKARRLRRLSHRITYGTLGAMAFATGVALCGFVGFIVDHVDAVPNTTEAHAIVGLMVATFGGMGFACGAGGFRMVWEAITKDII